MCFYVMKEFEKGNIAQSDLACVKRLCLSIGYDRIGLTSPITHYCYLNEALNNFDANDLRPMIFPEIPMKIGRDNLGRKAIYEGYHSLFVGSSFPPMSEGSFYRVNGQAQLCMSIKMVFHIPKGTKFFVNTKVLEYVSERISTNLVLYEPVVINNEGFFGLYEIVQKFKSL